jgi:hypothetical protein
MGLILDSSVLIRAERAGQNARQMLAAISGNVGNTDIAISVVTLTNWPTARPVPTRRSEGRSGNNSSMSCSRPYRFIRFWVY